MYSFFLYRHYNREIARSEPLRTRIPKHRICCYISLPPHPYLSLCSSIIRHKVYSFIYPYLDKIRSRNSNKFHNNMLGRKAFLFSWTSYLNSGEKKITLCKRKVRKTMINLICAWFCSRISAAICKNLGRPLSSCFGFPISIWLMGVFVSSPWNLIGPLGRPIDRSYHDHDQQNCSFFSMSRSFHHFHACCCDNGLVAIIFIHYEGKPFNIDI